MEENRNSKVLASFVKYCGENPEQRFWQALRNWCGKPFIFAGNIEYGDNGEAVWPELVEDTFHWEGRYR